MNTIMTRSAVLFWHGAADPDLAFLIDDRGDGLRKVTWAEVLTARRERQAQHMRRKLFAPSRRAWQLRVRYFDQPLMGGWQALIYRLPYERVWIDRDRQHLRPVLMTLFPTTLPLGDDDEQWAVWKPEFAALYRRREKDGHPVGVANFWYGPGRDQIELR